MSEKAQELLLRLHREGKEPTGVQRRERVNGKERKLSPIDDILGSGLAYKKMPEDQIFLTKDGEKVARLLLKISEINAKAHGLQGIHLD